MCTDKYKPCPFLSVPRNTFPHNRSEQCQCPQDFPRLLDPKYGQHSPTTANPNLTLLEQELHSGPSKRNKYILTLLKRGNSGRVIEVGRFIAVGVPWLLFTIRLISKWTWSRFKTIKIIVSIGTSLSYFPFQTLICHHLFQYKVFLILGAC